jgi:hypothetical protein
MTKKKVLEHCHLEGCQKSTVKHLLVKKHLANIHLTYTIFGPHSYWRPRHLINSHLADKPYDESGPNVRRPNGIWRQDVAPNWGNWWENDFWVKKHFVMIDISDQLKLLANVSFP